MSVTHSREKRKKVNGYGGHEMKDWIQRKEGKLLIGNSKRGKTKSYDRDGVKRNVRVQQST